MGNSRARQDKELARINSRRVSQRRKILQSTIHFLILSLDTLYLCVPLQPKLRITNDCPLSAHSFLGSFLEHQRALPSISFILFETGIIIGLRKDVIANSAQNVGPDRDQRYYDSPQPDRQYGRASPSSHRGW